MDLLRRFARLDPRHRAQAIRAIGWLIASTCAVRLCSYPTLRRLVERLPPRRVVQQPLTPAEAARALRAAAHVVPSATCLASTLAAACLLRRERQACTVTIGVQLDDDRRLHAHAWLEHGGEIVTGGDTAARYRVLMRDPITPGA